MRVSKKFFKTKKTKSKKYINKSRKKNRKLKTKGKKYGGSVTNKKNLTIQEKEAFNFFLSLEVKKYENKISENEMEVIWSFKYNEAIHKFISLKDKSQKGGEKLTVDEVTAIRGFRKTTMEEAKKDRDQKTEEARKAKEDKEAQERKKIRQMRRETLVEHVKNFAHFIENMTKEAKFKFMYFPNLNETENFEIEFKFEVDYEDDKYSELVTLLPENYRNDAINQLKKIKMGYHALNNITEHFLVENNNQIEEFLNNDVLRETEMAALNKSEGGGKNKKIGGGGKIDRYFTNYSTASQWKIHKTLFDFLLYDHTFSSKFVFGSYLKRFSYIMDTEYKDLRNYLCENLKNEFDTEINKISVEEAGTIHYKTNGGGKLTVSKIEIISKIDRYKVGPFKYKKQYKNKIYPEYHKGKDDELVEWVSDFSKKQVEYATETSRALEKLLKPYPEWYHKDMSEEDAEEMIIKNNKSEGMFLVINNKEEKDVSWCSDLGRNSYIITYVKDNNITHTVFTKHDKGFFTHKKKYIGNTVEELVENLKSKKILKTPVPREDPPRPRPSPEELTNELRKLIRKILNQEDIQSLSISYYYESENVTICNRGKYLEDEYKKRKKQNFKKFLTGSSLEEPSFSSASETKEYNVNLMVLLMFQLYYKYEKYKCMIFATQKAIITAATLGGSQISMPVANISLSNVDFLFSGIGTSLGLGIFGPGAKMTYTTEKTLAEELPLYFNTLDKTNQKSIVYSLEEQAKYINKSFLGYKLVDNLAFNIPCIANSYSKIKEIKDGIKEENKRPSQNPRQVAIKTTNSRIKNKN